MTVQPLPAIARQEKPARIRHRHPDVGGRALARVPGRRGMPVFGILPFAVLNPQRFATRMHERFGPVHRFYACGNWNVQLVGAEANEFVLFDQAGNFSAQGGWAPVFGRHFDGGLLLRDGEDHQWHRKLIATSFKGEQLQAYLALFSRNIAARVPGWSGERCDLYELAQGLTFANGYSAFLGADPARATREDLLAFRYLMRAAIAVLTVPFPGTAEARAAWAKRHVTSLIAPMLRRPVAPERTDLLAVLCRMRDEGLLEEEEIVSHLTFVIAASFDALSSGTVSTLYYLARHPEWQDRVRDELVSNVPDLGAMTLAQLGRCEAAEWSIKEALRLNAAAPVLWRRSIRPFRFGGFDFPAGTVTGVNPMLTHMLAELWPEPQAYDPSRFAPEEVRQRPKFAFVPFGGGAHGCLGANFAYLQIRALLRHVLERHELVYTAKAPPRWYHWPNCRPKDRLEIEFRWLG